MWANVQVGPWALSSLQLFLHAWNPLIEKSMQSSHSIFAVKALVLLIWVSGKHHVQIPQRILSVSFPQLKEQQLDL